MNSRLRLAASLRCCAVRSGAGAPPDFSHRVAWDRLTVRHGCLPYQGQDQEPSDQRGEREGFLSLRCCATQASDANPP